MKLFLSIAAGLAVLKATVPGPGNYYLFSDDGRGNRRVVASGYAFEACHVAVRVATTNTHRIFTAKWEPER